MHRDKINYMQRLKYVQNKIKREATNKNRKIKLSLMFTFILFYTIFTENCCKSENFTGIS